MSQNTGPERIHKYLSSPNFSRSIVCPRTNHSISFSEIGDLDRCPVLFVPGGVCSMWFPVPLDEICRESGIRLITLDRPGCGHIPSVPLSDRLDVSCKHILSVLEHLKIELRHMIAFSTGIYYALHLLRNYHTELGGFVQPIFLSPWIPSPSPTTTTRQGEAMTTIPDLAFVLDPNPRSGSRSNEGQARAPMLLREVDRSTGTPTTSRWSKRTRSESSDKVGAGTKTQTTWGEQASVITTDYIRAKRHRGIADARQNGSEWFLDYLKSLSELAKSKDWSLVVTIWFGTGDTIVSREQHLWLQRSINSTPRLSCKAYKVEGGDHVDLLWRDDGLKQVFAMIHFRERVYYGG